MKNLHLTAQCAVLRDLSFSKTRTVLKFTVLKFFEKLVNFWGGFLGMVSYAIGSNEWARSIIWIGTSIDADLAQLSESKVILKFRSWVKLIMIHSLWFILHESYFMTQMKKGLDWIGAIKRFKYYKGLKILPINLTFDLNVISTRNCFFLKLYNLIHNIQYITYSMKHTGCNQSNQGASYISLIAFSRFPSFTFVR